MIGNNFGHVLFLFNGKKIKRIIYQKCDVTGYERQVVLLKDYFHEKSEENLYETFRFIYKFLPITINRFFLKALLAWIQIFD